MQKKNPNKNKLIKQTIIITIIALLLLLLIFAEDIIKLANKNKLNLAENTEPQAIATEANPPTTSAGIIPIKWDGENWVITTKTDTDWYDYKSGKPAYMMLNDGTYQSELQVDMTNKKLAEENIGMKVQPNELGTIFVWIPSFAINENGSDIKYIKDIQTPEEGWTKPEIFTYRQTNETYPDFLLTGIWFEKDVDNAYSSKINEMNQEESIYGFIRNTVATSSDQTTQNTIEKYIANLVGATSVRNTQENLPNVALSTEEYPIDPTNPNRIILKIVNTKNQDPIKAKAYYDKETGLIKIEVTYTKNGISKILDEDGNTLSENSKTADTGDKILEKTEYTFTVIDKAGNKKRIKVTGVIPVFYGKEVTNYDCSVEGIKWRIFHKDDENIYLIADDYVPYADLPTSTKGNALNKSSDYKAYFSNILKDYTGSEWILNNTNENAQKWLSKYLKEYPNSTNNNIKAVAYMMDTDSWNSFAGTDAEYVIGGPTLELFCASYKVTHPDRYIQCDSITSDGCQIKWSDWSYYANGINGITKDEYGSIYIKSDSSKARGMWIASPSSGGTNYLMYAYYSGSVTSNNYLNALGFHPIVCIKSGIGLQNNGDGTYRLDIPIEARAYYDETEEKMKIEVTYTKNGIAKILDEDGNTLSQNSLTAETTILRNGTYKYTVVDKLGNTKEVTAKVEGLKVYVIQNLEELKEFRDEVNAGNNFSGIKVIQTADIQMNEGKYTINEETGEITFDSDAEQWEPIGNYSVTSNSFSGDYEGQGYTISGIYIDSDVGYQGLFGYCANGTIKNLNINNSVITSTANYVGGIAGSANNVENCSNSGEITASNNVGGITGMAYGNINNCYNTGKIDSDDCVGGITGYTYGNISNCYNTGEISGGKLVGGIIGGANNNCIEVYNSYNAGKINGRGCHRGGIIGEFSGSSITLNNNYNIGEIIGEITDSTYSIGGIIGYSSGSTIIENCSNYVSINGSYNLGGIAGEISNGTIKKCNNKGNIVATNYWSGGGIVGFSSNVVNIEASYNIGDITGVRGVGGIASMLGQTSTVTNCYNIGKVNGSGDCIGAVGGGCYRVTFKQCYCETGTADYGVGYPQSNSGCTFGTKVEIIPKIQALDEYKADEYNINNGYPILSWQTNNDKLNLINGEGAFVEDTKGINNGYPLLAWQLEK